MFLTTILTLSHCFIAYHCRVRYLLPICAEFVNLEGEDFKDRSTIKPTATLLLAEKELVKVKLILLVGT